MIPSRAGAAAVMLLAAALVACGAPPPAEAPEGAAAPPLAGAAEEPGEAEGAAAPAASSAQAPRRPSVPVAGSRPDGVSPLTEEEQKELKAQCAALSRAIATASRKRGEKRPAVEIAEDFLSRPPAIQGIDVPRCAALMLRDLRVFMAASAESEAIIGLKRIMLGMSAAMEGEPPALCPSAPPVPAHLGSLQAAPYTSTQADWSPPGWRCVRFEIIGPPQRWQYELRSDPKAQTFEAIARGYPVQGGPPAELFLAGKVEGGRITPSSDVHRR